MEGNFHSELPIPPKLMPRLQCIASIDLLGSGDSIDFLPDAIYIDESAFIDILDQTAWSHT